MGQLRVVRWVGRRPSVDPQGGWRLLRPCGNRQQLPQPIEAARPDAQATALGISGQASPVSRKPEIVRSASDQTMILKIRTPTIPVPIREAPVALDKQFVCATSPRWRCDAGPIRDFDSLLSHERMLSLSPFS